MPVTSGTGNICSVEGCRSNNKKDKKLSFFSLPVDEERLIKWGELIGRPELAKAKTKRKSHLVCSLHFDKSAITYTPKLNRDALPSKFLPSRDSQGTSSTLELDRRRAEIDKSTEEKSSQTEYKTVSIAIACTFKHADTKSTASQTPETLSCDSPRELKLRAELQESNRINRILLYELNKLKQEVQARESIKLERVSSESEDVD